MAQTMVSLAPTPADLYRLPVWTLKYSTSRVLRIIMSYILAKRHLR